MTSDAIAMLWNRQAVVRRKLADLKEKGFGQHKRGHGGSPIVAPEQGRPAECLLFAGRGPNSAFSPADDDPQCFVEQAANAGLDDALRDAKIRLSERFGKVIPAALARDFQKRVLGIQRSAAFE